MLLSLVQKSFTLMQCNLDLVNEVPILVAIYQNIAISDEFRPVCNFAVLCSIKNEWVEPTFFRLGAGRWTVHSLSNQEHVVLVKYKSDPAIQVVYPLDLQMCTLIF